MHYHTYHTSSIYDLIRNNKVTSHQVSKSERKQENYLKFTELFNEKSLLPFSFVVCENVA